MVLFSWGLDKNFFTANTCYSCHPFKTDIKENIIPSCNSQTIGYPVEAHVTFNNIGQGLGANRLQL